MTAWAKAHPTRLAAFFRLGDHGGSPLHWGGFLIDYLRLIIEIWDSSLRPSTLLRTSLRMTKTVDSRFRGNDKLFVRAVSISLAAFFIATALTWVFHPVPNRGGVHGFLESFNCAPACVFVLYMWVYCQKMGHHRKCGICGLKDAKNLIFGQITEQFAGIDSK